MHCILVTLGTDGDVYPYVGLGIKLRLRGHRVTLVASAHYEPLAQANGFEFRALVSESENKELFGHPDFWDPVKTVLLSSRWGARIIARQYEMLASLVSPDAVLAVNPGVFAAPLVHEKHSVPMVSLLLQPGMIPSTISPPAMHGLEFLRLAPTPVWKLVWRCLDLVGDVLIGPELNRVRSRLGLKPMKRLFSNWLSPDLVLGLFPEWYASPQRDWPSQIRLVGFPMFDGVAELPASLLEFCCSGSPPIVFTFGTGMAHPAKLFAAALEACELLGARGIFLTKHLDQLPARLPESIHCCASAPFQKLFPLCAAVVHHGGVGTVAKALAAGTPQLIRPICFDQTDNGMRVKAMGAGDWLKGYRATGKRIAAALGRLRNPEIKQRCCSIATRFKDGDGLGAAAQQIEDFAVRMAHNRGGR